MTNFAYVSENSVLRNVNNNNNTYKIVEIVTEIIGNKLNEFLNKKVYVKSSYSFVKNLLFLNDIQGQVNDLFYRVVKDANYITILIYNNNHTFKTTVYLGKLDDNNTLISVNDDVLTSRTLIDENEAISKLKELQKKYAEMMEIQKGFENILSN